MSRRQKCKHVLKFQIHKPIKTCAEISSCPSFLPFCFFQFFNWFFFSQSACVCFTRFDEKSNGNRGRKRNTFPGLIRKQWNYRMKKTQKIEWIMQREEKKNSSIEFISKWEKGWKIQAKNELLELKLMSGKFIINAEIAVRIIFSTSCAPKWSNLCPLARRTIIIFIHNDQNYCQDQCSGQLHLEMWRFDQNNRK